MVVGVAVVVVGVVVVVVVENGKWEFPKIARHQWAVVLTVKSSPKISGGSRLPVSI